MSWSYCGQRFNIGSRSRIVWHTLSYHPRLLFWGFNLPSFLLLYFTRSYKRRNEIMKWNHSLFHAQLHESNVCFQQYAYEHVKKKWWVTFFFLLLCCFGLCCFPVRPLFHMLRVSRVRVFLMLYSCHRMFGFPCVWLPAQSVLPCVSANQLPALPPVLSHDCFLCVLLVHLCYLTPVSSRVLSFPTIAHLCSPVPQVFPTGVFVHLHFMF